MNVELICSSYIMTDTNPCVHDRGVHVCQCACPATCPVLDARPLRNRSE